MKSGGFVQFAQEVCGVRLTRGQRVLASVAYDRAEPGSFAGEDREVARKLFGDVDTIPPDARPVVAIVKGARIGGSHIFGALRLLHLALTVPVHRLAKGEHAFAIVVAPDMRLARQTLRFAAGAAEAAPSIRKFVGNVTSESFTLAREGGKTVAVECLPATRGGSAVRGRTLVGAVLSECSFFKDESAVVNDLEVYKGIAPRIIAGGQLVIESTPWAEAGLLFDLFTANHGKPTTAIAAHAPTLLMRDDPHSVAIVSRERQRDPDNAAREFDADFMPAGSGLFFEPATIDAAMDLPPIAGGAEVRAVTAGADFGFRSDSSAIVIVKAVGEMFDMVDSLELRPQRGAPLLPSAVVDAFAVRAKAAGVGAIVADSHYIESVRELLGAHDLGLRDAAPGQEGKAQTYVVTRTLLREKRLRLPKDPRLAAQLKAIVSKPTPGGGLVISSPRRGGQGHGDLVSALVLAVWAAKGSGRAVVEYDASYDDDLPQLRV